MNQQNQVEVAVRPKTETGVGVRIGTGLVIGLGVALVAGYLMAGYAFFTLKGTEGVQGASLTTAVTTCGTYTSPDGGLNEPFVTSGQVDPDCVIEATEKDVCYKGRRPYCLMAEPTPPKANVTLQGSQAEVTFEWTTDVATYNNCAVFVRQGAVPNAWRCIYGDDNDCRAMQYVRCESGAPTTHHVTQAGQASLNQEFYFGVLSWTNLQGQGPVLKSEVRTFSTVPPSTTPTL